MALGMDACNCGNKRFYFIDCFDDVGAGLFIQYQ